MMSDSIPCSSLSGQEKTVCSVGSLPADADCSFTAELVWFYQNSFSVGMMVGGKSGPVAGDLKTSN